MKADGYLARQPVNPDEQVLQVAREHGTRIAAVWSGRSASTVRALRQRVDGYDRGRGHPSKAEMAAMAARWDCPCPRCADLRSEEARRSSLRHRSSGDHHVTELDGSAWRAHAACRCLPADPWFPVTEHDRDESDAVAICRACPVGGDCLRFALANRIDHGIFGGLDETQRRPLLDLLRSAA